MTEDKMVGWHNRLNGHKSEQTPGDSEGQGSMVCCRTQKGNNILWENERHKGYLVETINKFKRTYCSAPP